MWNEGTFAAELGIHSELDDLMPENSDIILTLVVHRWGERNVDTKERGLWLSINAM